MSHGTTNTSLLYSSANFAVIMLHDFSQASITITASQIQAIISFLIGKLNLSGLVFSLNVEIIAQFWLIFSYIFLLLVG